METYKAPSQAGAEFGGGNTMKLESKLRPNTGQREHLAGTVFPQLLSVLSTWWVGRGRACWY